MSDRVRRRTVTEGVAQPHAYFVARLRLYSERRFVHVDEARRLIDTIDSNNVFKRETSPCQVIKYLEKSEMFGKVVVNP